MNEKACRECHFISTKAVCPNCKATSLSDDFTDIVIIIHPERSAIAKALNATNKGKYALRVR